MSDTNGRRARELLSELGEERDFWDPVEGEMIHDPERVAIVKAALDDSEARGRPQWRPASERPERRGWYLTVPSEDNEHAPPTPTCTERLWNGERWMGLAPVEVTHWAELPEPPTPTTEKG